MDLQKKLVFHVVSVLVLVGIFQIFVGFEMSRPTAYFLLLLLIVDVAGDFYPDDRGNRSIGGGIR